MSTTREALLGHLDRLLTAPGCRDYCHNGLQVEGVETIGRLATATTASQTVIDRAVAAGAQALLVHHGLIWGGATRIDGMLRRRLAPLLASGCNLFAYHLPLDAQAEHGNNVLIIRELGACDAGPFAEHHGLAIGRLGGFEPAVGLDDLIERCQRLFDHAVVHCPGADRPIRRIGAVSGGGQSHLADAAAAGCDAFITGEASEQNWHEAAELGCHLLACGHHATEALAIHRLGALLAQQLGCDHLPIRQTNPI